MIWWALWLGCVATPPTKPTSAPQVLAQNAALQGRADVTWRLDHQQLKGVIWFDDDNAHLAIKDPLTDAVMAKMIIASDMISVTDQGHQVQFIALQSAEVLDSLGWSQRQLTHALAGKTDLRANGSSLRLTPTATAAGDGPSGVQLVVNQQMIFQQDVQQWTPKCPPAGAFSHAAPHGFDVRPMEELAELTFTQVLLSMIPSNDPPTPTPKSPGR